MWMMLLVASIRPVAECRCGLWGDRVRSSMNTCGILCVATRCKASPSQRLIMPLSASQIRTALANMLAKTCWGSANEPLMSLSTSVVARCCSAVVFASRLRAFISVSRRTVRDTRRRWLIEPWGRFCFAVLRSRALAEPPTGLERRRIVFAACWLRSRLLLMVFQWKVLDEVIQYTLFSLDRLARHPTAGRIRSLQSTEKGEPGRRNYQFAVNWKSTAHAADFEVRKNRLVYLVVAESRLLFLPRRATLNAKICWHIRASASPCLFRETFVASLYGLRDRRSLGRAAWQRQIHIELQPVLLAGIALGLGLGRIERSSNLPLVKQF